MYSKWRERLRHTLGFRLALWYAAIFVVSSLALTGLTYLLVAASLRQYDREIIGTALVQYEPVKNTRLAASRSASRPSAAAIG